MTPYPHHRTRTIALLLLATLILAACRPANPAPFIPSTPAPSPTPSQAADPSVVHIAAGEWPPYTGKGLPNFGCDAWVVSEAFASQGIKVIYDFFPWARARDLSERGAWDGTIEWDKTPILQERFLFSQDFLSRQEWVFFYNVDRPFAWGTLGDLSGKVVGVTSGYTYSNAFESLPRKGSILFEEASSDQANFRKLLMGRIDVFPMERSVGQMILDQKFTAAEKAQITHDPRPFKEFHPYVLLSRVDPRNKARMERFDQGFQQLKRSGRYAEIMKECAP